MAISRPLLLALIGVALAAVTFYASTAARNGAATAEAPAVEKVVASPAPVKPSKARGAPGKAAAAKKAAPAAKPAPAPAKPKRKAPRTKAGLVAGAIKDNRVVVLFFSQSGGADDRATASAVRSLGKGPLVISDRIGNLAKYGPAVAGSGIAQAPTVVIVGKDRKARLIEGYVDESSLAQEVADAAR